MIATALVLLWSVFGALWRKEFGRCVVLGKTALKIIASALMLPLWLAVPGEPLWWAICIFCTLLVIVFFTTSFCPGPSFTNARVFMKYGPFGLGYWLARLYAPEQYQNTIGEYFLGGSVFACVGIAWYWVV